MIYNNVYTFFSAEQVQDHRQISSYHFFDFLLSIWFPIRANRQIVFLRNQRNRRNMFFWKSIEVPCVGWILTRLAMSSDLSGTPFKDPTIIRQRSGILTSENCCWTFNKPDNWPGSSILHRLSIAFSFLYSILGPYKYLK